MASKRNDDPPAADLKRVGGAGNGAEPNWLADYQGEADTSLEGVKQYHIVPRMKIVQAMSRQELKDQFGEGSVIVVPGQTLLFKKGQSIDFVPLFFFPEFMKWSDRKDKGSKAIMDRTLDPASDLAIRSRDPNRRNEGYGTFDNRSNKHQYTARYQEHLNFVGVLDSGEFAGTIVTLCFVRGEHSKGIAFMNAITMRRIGGKVAPLWSQRWTITPSFRDQGEKKWWGLDFANPAENPYIRQDQGEAHKNFFQEFKTLYEERRLQTDASDADEERTEGDGGDVDTDTGRAKL